MSKFLFHRHHMQWHTSSKPIVSQLDQHSSKHSMSNNWMCWGWYSSFVSCMGLDAPGDHVWLSITYSLHKELPLDIGQQMLCNCKRPIWIQHFHNAHDFWKKEGFNDLEGRDQNKTETKQKTTMYYHQNRLLGKPQRVSWDQKEKGPWSIPQPDQPAWAHPHQGEHIVWTPYDLPQHTISSHYSSGTRTEWWATFYLYNDW